MRLGSLQSVRRPVALGHFALGADLGAAGPSALGQAVLGPVPAVSVFGLFCIQIKRNLKPLFAMQYL